MEYRHPIDGLLSERSWQRVELGQLGEERLIVKLLVINPKFQFLDAVDMLFWKEAETPRAEIVIPGEGPQAFKHAGHPGNEAIDYSLTPCNCPTVIDGAPRWNPLALPLAWRPEMSNTKTFRDFVTDYLRLVYSQPMWQCIDVRWLLQT